ncbi:MAG: DUF6199 family natural product biosynthesis protein [Jatrophihabitans sp.]|uniref:DUF6199 family natural product biosynthesis protein n=1 Tax=Jatrophihabitans sp. TaxID=1932789 RepID=UPI003F7F57D5
MDEVVRAVPVPAHGSSGGHGTTWAWVAGPVFIVVGLLFVARPQLQWQWNRWQYKHPDAMEPSAAGLRLVRGIAVVFVIVGVVLLVVAATH